LEEITDVQYGGVVEKFMCFSDVDADFVDALSLVSTGGAEKFLDLSVDGDLLVDSSVSGSDVRAAECQAVLAEKLSVDAVDFNGVAVERRIGEEIQGAEKKKKKGNEKKKEKKKKETSAEYDETGTEHDETGTETKKEKAKNKKETKKENKKENKKEKTENKQVRRNE